jgi:hypothetical protein
MANNKQSNRGRKQDLRRVTVDRITEFRYESRKTA